MSKVKKSVSALVFTPNRLEALTDGIFAIVMTLLVLDLSITGTICRFAGNFRFWCPIIIVFAP